MGAGQSTVSSLTLTRADVLKATEQPRLLVNRLFSFFADKFAQKDLLALANPARCSDYVFVMADALDRLFYELRVEPGKDKKGVLLFRKAQDLTRLEPESAEGQQRRILCLSIAFFYIRIFQIYASLALSVNDDLLYGTGSGMPFGSPVGGPARAMVAPGLEGTYAIGGSSSGSSEQHGGVTDENIRKFSILKHYLTRDLSRPAGSFYFDKYPNIVLNVTKESKNLTIFRTTSSTEGPIAVTCNFMIRLSGLKDERRYLTFDKFSSTEEIYNEKLKANGPIGYFVTKSGDHSYSAEKTNEAVDDIIFRVMVSAREVALGRRLPNKARVRVVGQPGVAPGLGQPQEVGVPDGLKTAFLLARLRQVPKPLAHCVARSLQLLNVDALSSPRIPTEVRSSICKVKFEASHGGIPDVGTAITSAPGIGALQQLFFDKISAAKPAMSDDSAASYQTFVKKMAEQFGENPSAPTIYLGSVINKMDKACVGAPTKRDKIITVKDPNSIRLAQQSVQTLWKLQIEHDKKAIEILSKLVVVAKIPGGGVKIGLNPLILKTGNPGVAIVAKEARDLLVKYYTNCESAFRIAAIPLGTAGSAIA
jgi:hypothetical protein